MPRDYPRNSRNQLIFLFSAQDKALFCVTKSLYLGLLIMLIIRVAKMKKIQESQNIAGDTRQQIISPRYLCSSKG